MSAPVRRCQISSPALFIASLVLGVLLIGASTAQALPTTEIEPNDDIFQMTGPIGPDGAAGQLASSSDSDYFLVRLRPQRQIEVRFSTGTCNDADLELVTLEGSSIASSSSMYNNETVTRALTTSGTVGGPSFLAKIVAENSYSGTCDYSVAFTGAGGGPTDVVDSSPLPSVPSVSTTEPNDFVAQANGPLSAGINYTGAIETANDIDWLFAPLRAGTTLTMELATGSAQASAELLSSATSNSLLDLSPYSNTSKAGSYAIASTQIYYIRLEGSLGARYRLQLSPASAVGYPPPRAWVANRRVKRGRSIRIYVENSSATTLTWKLTRKSKVRKRGTAAIRSGVAKIPTRSLRKYKRYSLQYTIPGIGKRTATISIR